LVADAINTGSNGNLVATPDPDSSTRLIITAKAGSHLQSLDFANNVTGTLPAEPTLHYRRQGAAQALPTFTYRQNNQ
jgi:hypothetical protein